MIIVRAKEKDAEEITRLTIRSKNHWKYGDEQIEEWRDDLTITSNYINENGVYKLINHDSLIGYYAYGLEQPSVVKLNYLFIDPEYIGQGNGKLLLDDFLERIGKMDIERIIVDADPNAESFYERFGFIVVGKLQSSIKDRYLPVMEKEINCEKRRPVP